MAANNPELTTKWTGLFEEMAQKQATRLKELNYVDPGTKPMNSTGPGVISSPAQEAVPEQPDLFDEEEESESFFIRLSTGMLEDGETYQAGLIFKAIGKTLLSFDAGSEEDAVAAVFKALRDETREFMGAMNEGQDLIMTRVSDEELAREMLKMMDVATGGKAGAFRRR